MLQCKKQILHQVEVPADAAYLALVEDILANAEVRSMAKYIQHGHTSCLHHSVLVSYLSYRYCVKKGLDARAAARGGLLHDLFLYDWHHRKRQPGEWLHGFEHPRKALQNAKRLFHLTPKEEEIILRHMWPLTVKLPRSKEAFVVVLVDKYCSLLETFRRPVVRWTE